MQDWHPDYISSYNSLTDRHLRRFFSQPARRRHLGRTNMITPNGHVIAEREWRRQGRTQLNFRIFYTKLLLIGCVKQHSRNLYSLKIRI